jgi:hypothetical protein
MRVNRTLERLRARWTELFGVAAPPDMTAALLAQAIAWASRWQSMAT